MSRGNVKSKQDFISLLNELIHDFQENRQDWENQDIPSYFESMKSWVEDTDDSSFTGDLWEIISNVIVSPKYYE